MWQVTTFQNPQKCYSWVDVVFSADFYKPFTTSIKVDLSKNLQDWNQKEAVDSSLL